jgi:hypothetical protein
MKTIHLMLAMAAGLAFSGAAQAGTCGASPSAAGQFAGSANACFGVASAPRQDVRQDARIYLAQYYERRGGYDDGYGGGGGGAYRYCRTWAQGMVAIGMEAARKGCLQYGPQGLHTNFDAHMDFCLRSSPGRTQRAAARANQLLYSCDQ